MSQSSLQAFESNVHLGPSGRRLAGSANAASGAGLALTLDEAIFRRIATLLEHVYYQTDETGRVVHVSPAYEALWGQDASKLRGEDWFHAVYREDLPRVSHARLLLLKGEPFAEEYRILRGNGASRWIRDRASLIEQPTLQIVGMAHDVSDERELQEARRQAGELEAQATLASTIAHDFGNLLQGVMGCLSTALRDGTAPEKAREYTQHALQAVHGGAMLLAQLLPVGRDESMHPSVVGIDTTITGCSTLLQGLLGDHIQLDVEARARHGTILAHPAQIERILLNLAANARDAMPQGGKLFIKTAEVHSPGPLGVGPFVQLVVRDVGCGMDGATKGRIFEPFFTTKGAGRGTGLGLAAVRSLTQGLGGHIDVESELGLGSTFIFHFPLVAALPQLRARPPAELPSADSRRPEPASCAIGAHWNATSERCLPPDPCRSGT